MVDIITMTEAEDSQEIDTTITTIRIIEIITTVEITYLKKHSLR